MGESGDVIKTWTDTDRATVLADHAGGLNSEQIARHRGIPSSTVRRWIARYGPASSSEARANYARIALRAQSLIGDYLDTVENASPETILKQGIVLNAIAGTAYDKVHKEPDPAAEPLKLIIVIPGIDQVTIPIQPSEPVTQEAEYQQLDQ